jgi:hypothetical protein
VLIINEDMIPVEFKELIVKEEIKINKTEIKNFLKTLKEDE